MQSVGFYSIFLLNTLITFTMQCTRDYIYRYILNICKDTSKRRIYMRRKVLKLQLRNIRTDQHYPSGKY